MADAKKPPAAGQEARIAVVEDLLARMTWIEKAGQMSQVALHVDPTPADVVDAVRAGHVGSFLNTRSLAQRNELQRVAVEESRLHVPLVFGRDVIHGFKTIFPIPLGQAASFDPALVEEAAAVAAREASELGIDWTFAPMVDIARDPRWGRVAESLGEDPHLGGRMAAAMVRGFQGSDPSAQDRVAACAKHFAGYGAAEAGREYNTTYVPEQLLREIYLPPFKACVDAGALTLMTGFNDLNGIPATASALLVRRILKTEWGFQGFVVSDWASVMELVPHGIAEDAAQAAALAVRAGVDMEMATTAYFESLPALVASGAVSGELVDACVRRILTVKHRLGLFTRPYTQKPAVSVALSEAHREVARALARESVVLLKNEGQTLPLSGAVRSVALIGPLAHGGGDQLGCWAFDGEPSASHTVLAALKDRAARAGFTLHVAKGVPDVRSTDESGFDEAVLAARQSDVVVAVAGEDANLSGEAHSRAFLGLPGVQDALLARLAATGRPLVVVYFAGRPLTIADSLAHARAALYAWHPGTMAGPALVDLLFGDAVPSGKLPISFPRSVGQIPIYYNAKRTGRPASSRRPGVPLGTPLDPEGFTSSYLDVDVTPEFPFGFGLSYTTFAYRDLQVTPARVAIAPGGADDLTAGQPVTVSVRVENTGAVAGVEVVQIYLRDRVASITRPARELRRFERVALAPGEIKELRFTLERADFAFVGQDMEAVVEPGTFDVFAGGDSRAELSRVIELTAPPAPARPSSRAT